MSSEVEESLDIADNHTLVQRARDVATSLDMTTRVSFTFLIAILAFVATARDSPTPTPSAIAEKSLSVSPSPAESAAPFATPGPAHVPSPGRNVRISFVPPPLEGTISLGIYDGSGRLVRVLHQEAELNEFTIGEDGLVTQWDGKNNDGADLPIGKYHARGYFVGHFKVDDLGRAPPPSADTGASTNVEVRLMPNPLTNDKSSVVDLGVGVDRDGSYLQTVDGLPLFTVSESPNLGRAFIIKKGEKAVDLWQDDGAGGHQFHVSNVDRMMAFDCGDFELK